MRHCQVDVRRWTFFGCSILAAPSGVAPPLVAVNGVPIDELTEKGTAGTRKKAKRGLTLTWATVKTYTDFQISKI